ncbi:MAG: type II secretion system protein [Parcubacteria group bacterium]
MQNFRKGFTLIELLIVIGILAVLSSVVVIILNPGELLAEGRDSRRISDLNTIRAALMGYLTQVPNADLGSCNSGGICTFNPGAGKGPFTNTTCSSISAATNITGSGWVDVNFASIPSGSPIPSLPIDPINNANYFYAYACTKTPYFFELNTRLESQKYRNEMVLDGGNKNNCDSSYTADTCFYEIGTKPDLNI